MFRMTRDWWSNGKAQHLIGLFAFEFVVIVLGVLTAQAVADWSRDRAAQRDMLANKERADAQIAKMAATAIAYDRVIPCMDERMIMVMRAASGDGQIDPAMLVRPVVRAEPFNGLSDETIVLLRARHGAEVTDRYAYLAVYAQRSAELVGLLANGWQSLSIMSPEAGKVGAGDRQEARIVASNMRSTLRSLRKTSVNISNLARDLRIAPRFAARLRAPAGCADLWRWNSVVYDPDDVPGPA